MILVCISSFLTFAEPSASFGWANDNLTNFSNLPLDGEFGGPDDKYTFASFLHYYEDDWKILLNYHVITDRVNNHRYDYLYLMYIRNYKKEKYSYSLGAGLEGTGNLGGEYLQNSFHRSIGVDELDIPYTGFVPGLIGKAELEYYLLNYFENKISLNFYSALKISTTRVTKKITAALPFTISAYPVTLQLFPGHDFHFSLVEECVSGNSFFYKTALSVPVMKKVMFTFGFSRNIIYSCPGTDNLAVYNKFTKTLDENQDILTIPQYYFVFSYGKKIPEIRDLPLP